MTTATATMPRHIVESFVGSRVGKDDTGQDCIVIEDVLLLSQESINGRRYTDECMQDAFDRRLYEQSSIANEHPEEMDVLEGRPRRNDEILGFNKNIRQTSVVENGKTIKQLRGDAWFTVRDRLTESVQRAAIHNPSLYKFSHNIDFAKRTVEADGTEVIHKIAKVYSVDLVQNGATTKSLFESEKRKMSTETTTATTETKPEKRTIRQVLESVFRFPRERRIMEDAGLPMDTTVDVAPDAPAEEQAADAFAEIIKAFMVDGDEDKAKKALRAYFQITSDSSSSSDGGDTTPAPTTESEKIKPLGMDGGLRILEAQKLPVTSALLRSIARLTESEAVDFLTVHGGVVKERDDALAKAAALSDEPIQSGARVTESAKTITPAKEGEKPYSRYLVTTSN